MPASISIDVFRLAASVEAVSSAASQEELLEAAASELSKLLHGTAAVLSCLKGDMLRDAASRWPDDVPPDSRFENYGYLLDDYPATKASLEARRPYTVSLADEAAEPAEAFVLRELGMQAVLAIPIVVSSRPWGLAEVYDARAREFREEEIALGDLFVRQVAALLAQLEHASAIERIYRETLASLANALEEKDAYTHEHTNRVAEFALDVAGELGVEQGELRAIGLGALLHDIGKIRVPESILNKPGPLDPDEWRIMRRHTIAGEAILRPIADLRDVLPVVRSSHERWDGRGYPDRLAARAIPLGARVIAVCDAFRAMIEPRPYRPARTMEEARRELVERAGTQFDPECVEALLRVLARGDADREELPLHRPAAAA